MIFIFIIFWIYFFSFSSSFCKISFVIFFNSFIPAKISLLVLLSSRFKLFNNELSFFFKEIIESEILFALVIVTLFSLFSSFLFSSSISLLLLFSFSSFFSSFSFLFKSPFLFESPTLILFLSISFLVSVLLVFSVFTCCCDSSFSPFFWK